MKEIEIVADMNELQLRGIIEAAKRDTRMHESAIAANNIIQAAAEHKLIGMQLAQAERE
ncbi:hypothetical protein [Paraburkholderia humisilvae]|uniref:Uncharacterized protein n=1 Tax=Paraburkholderia humisilvae TaxID=627669 RepID=A0A6J5CZQ6_9BURK|nr:hypothetical protein [Paraburkholderia humisilvae]CAB3746424.1 hypothetical protein LMG29542_00207 [Paraburkholderia humisilvae]